MAEGVSLTGNIPARGGRHYGLDWLRIAAFAILILYHIGMVFAPWDWVIKTNHSYPELIAPMSAVTPWRLALLFAVSGYASWHLLSKMRDAAAFAGSRSKRLLIPLAFGMAVLVPVEMWIRVAEVGYPHGYWRFWLHDYWRLGEFYGRTFPSWEHLWFVAYLWTYTMILAAVLAYRTDRGAAWVAGAIDWLTHGWRVLWVPVLLLAVAKVGLLFVVEEEHGLLRDWGGHAQFVPMFVAGFLLAGAPQLWPALRRVWKVALALSVVTGAVVVAVETLYPGEAIPPHWVMAGERAAQVAMGWTMTVALFTLADRYWNRDHRWRRTLAEAVFPFYLIHQPAIVAITWLSLPLKLNAWVEFGMLLAGTGAVCAVFYLIGREIGWLRPLIGLGPRVRRDVPVASPQPA
jgi:peptidoglycan/LPS O-acetylase OafA/YrhL